ncbi:NAD-binding oxidoreductase [Rhodoferax koreense]|uniref:NAD-binding oxidoreductase n=1 Tax=Rhodoferax koreensis TaxID=1842727 RepID=A0A1P8JZG1_9BURK|nr:Gfo/Idh/MocA family oxidoreductase [Rhodoferax koreense]APW39128.1 NAD-binding oxidoreductase [Rhodoferax koreense]
MKTSGNKLLRVGVLGCGMISADHFTAWARCQGAQVVAVCDPMIDRARARAGQFDIRAAYDSPGAMIAAESLDLIDIITPRETHAAMVRLAARDGIHALCEKPLCPTYAEAQALVEEVGGRIRVMVNENWRYRAYFRQIAEWLQAGKLGTVTLARLALWRSSMLPRAEDGRVHALTRQAFLAREARVLIAESLIHEIDVVRALFGEVEVLACSTGRACGEIIGEDSASLLLRTADGLTVSLDGVMTAAGHETRAPDRLEIAGTRCSVVLEGAVLKLIGAEQQTIVYDEAEVRQNCFNASIQHFVDQVKGGGPFWTSAQDQLGSLRVMEEAYRLAGAPTLLGPTRLPPIAPPQITGF